MRLPTKDEVLQKLKPLGINAANLAADPAMMAKAVQKTHKLIPIPWRWFVGRKRIERLLMSAANAASKAASSQHGANSNPPPEPEQTI